MGIVVVAVAIAQTIIPKEITAQSADPSVQSVPRIRSIVVPAQDPSQWPNGNWHPLPRSEYRALLKAAQSAAAGPASTWIEQVEYSATFINGAFRDGRLTASIRHTSSEAELLTLDPLNLAISDLHWPRERAVWGTAPDGRTALLVDGTETTLHGEWNLKGRRLPRSVEFDIHVAPATVSRFRLHLPPGYTLRASAGDVRGPIIEREGAWHTWLVDLGSQTRLRLTVLRAQEQMEATPLVLARSEVLHIIRQEGLRFQADFNLEVLESPVGRLTFRLPRDIEIFSISYGGETALSWRNTEHPNSPIQEIQVDLPTPLIGRSRPIRLQGIGSVQLGEPWKLPQATLDQSLFVNSQLHVRIESPLELRSFEMSGCRQTSTVSSAGNSDTLTFHQYLPDGELNVDVAHPASVVSAESVSHLDLGPETWTLTTDIIWTARGGTPFVTRCKLSPEWEVTDVRSLSDMPRASISNWETRMTPDGQQLLSVEFLEALTAGDSKPLRILARRLPASATESLPIPVVEPLDCRQVETLLTVSHPSTAALSTRSLIAMKRIDESEVPKSIQDSTLWRELQFQSIVRSTTLYSNSREASGELYLKNAERPMTAQIRVGLQLDSGRLTDNYMLLVSPQAVSLDHVMVYLTATGPSLNWELLGEQNVRLNARRIPADRHIEWNLPATGELWEIRLPSPQQGAFRLGANRTRTISSREMVALAFVPGAREFQGIVELRTKDEQPVEMRTSGLRSVEAADLGSEQGTLAPPAGRLWSYQNIIDSLSLHTPEEATEESPSLPATLRLRSLLSSSTESHDVHWATFRLGQAPNRGPFHFQLREPAELLAIRIDGQKVNPSRRGEEFTLPSLPEGSRELEIQYRTPIQSRWFGGRRPVLIPQTSWTVIDFQWTFALPPGVLPAGEPKGTALGEVLPSLSKTERIFGPLGRPDSATIFNPFLAKSWRQLFSTEPTPADFSTATPTGDGTIDVPQGWQTWRGIAPTQPDHLVLETWHRSKTLLLAWIGLLGCMVTGLVLRVGRFSGRGTVAATWLSLCLITVLFVTPLYAEIAGGCLLGTLIVILLPQSVIQPLTRRLPQRDNISMGSTESFQHGKALALIVGTALAAQTALAQESSSSRNNETRRSGTASRASSSPSITPRTIRNEVLIPVDRNGEPSASLPYVYLDEGLLDRLREIAGRRRSPSEYLISSADYQAEIDEERSAVVTARYQIALLSPRPTTRIEFPISNANFSGTDACRVNGTPQPILRGTADDRYVVELRRSYKNFPLIAPRAPDYEGAVEIPEQPISESNQPSSAGRSSADVEFFDLELKFHPPTAEVPTGGRFHVGIPPVAASRLTLTFDQAYPTINIPDSRGELVVSKNNRTVTTELGKVGQFRAIWSSTAEPIQLPAALEARVSCLVEAHPTRLEFHYRVDYRILRGSVDFVSWQLPRTMIVRDVDAPELLAYSMANPRDAMSRLHIEFAQPQTEDFTVDAWFTMPLESIDQQLTIPAVDLFGGEDNNEAIDVARSYLGIATPPEFRAGPLTDENDQVTAISSDSFMRSWSSKSGVRKPQVTVQLERPAELSLELIPLSPQRKVWKEQIAHIDDKRLRWTFTAALETNRTAAFQHTLIVDPRLQIDSISVQEDGAERLVRWSENGERILLYLSGKTTGLQNITLQATMPLPLGMRTPLPFIEVDQAEVAESNLMLYHHPELVLELDPIDSFTPADPMGSSQNGDQTDRFLGRLRSLGPDQLPTIRTLRRNDRVRVKSAALLQQNTDGRWRFKTVLRFEELRLQQTDLRIRIPAELTADYRLETGGRETQSELHPDGTVEIVFDQQPAVETFQIVVTSFIENTERGEWAIVPPHVADADIKLDYLLISPPDELIPTVPTARSMAWNALPSWLADSHDLDDEAVGWDLYQLSESSLKLRHASFSEAPRRPLIPLVETSHWPSVDEPEHGATRIHLSATGDHHLNLTWPADIQLRALLVNGRPVVPLIAEPGLMTIPLDDNRQPHVITAYWRRDHSERSAPVGFVSHEYPQPAGATVRRSLLTVTPPADLYCSFRNGFVPNAPLVQSIERLEGLVDMSYTRYNAGVLQVEETADLRTAIERLLHQATSQPAEAISGSEPPEPPSDESVPRSVSPVKRLQRLLDDVTVLEQTFAESASELNRTGSAEPARAPLLPSLVSGVDSNFEVKIDGLANRQTVRGHTFNDERHAPLSYWYLDWRLPQLLLALAGFLILAPGLRRLMTLEAGEWLHTHPALAWGLIGLLWWLCLVPSVFGLVLLMLSLGSVLLSRRRHNRIVEQTIE